MGTTEFKVRVCDRGHEVSGGNVYSIAGRAPFCRKCHLRRQREYHERKKARERRAEILSQMMPGREWQA